MPFQTSESGEQTVIRRASGATARNVSPVDARQIGALAAIHPLIAAANPLLMTLSSLRSGGAPASIDGLRTRLIEMVRELDAACEKASIPAEQRHLARYALCTAVDEAIQRVPWGNTANWARQSLMLHFFKDNNGGETFYVILDKLIAAPGKQAALLQLYYICLSLGFMGKFLLQDAAGRHAVVDLREQLYQLIRQGHPETDLALSNNWRGLSVAARQFKGFAFMWLTLAGMLLLCVGAYATLLLLLADARDDLALRKLALKPAPPSPQTFAPPLRPRLPQLLATEIAANQLQVRESQVESVVTLVSEGMFDSGSAVPSIGSVALVERVASAMDTLDGRIIVVGHTDNRPPRSLQFPTNDELSKERARSVARIVMGRLKDPSRVVFEGRGAGEPVVPNDSLLGQAKNRRVVITLRVSSGT